MDRWSVRFKWPIPDSEDWDYAEFLVLARTGEEATKRARTYLPPLGWSHRDTRKLESQK